MFKIKNGEKAFLYSIYLLMVLLVINVGVNGFYRNVVKQYHEEKNNLVALSEQLDNLSSVVMLADLGLRGYYINSEEGMLEPYQIALNSNNIEAVGVLMQKLNLDLSEYKKARMAYESYLELVGDMVKMLQNGNYDEVKQIVEEDRGLAAYNQYGPFIQNTKQLMQQKIKALEKNYHTWRIITGVFMVLFFVISLVVLVFGAIVFNRSRKQRIKLLADLEHSNRTMVFDSGDRIEAANQNVVVQLIIKNLKLAARFIKGVSENNYDLKWDGLNESNKHLNTENISGELMKLRDHLKELKAEDDKRLWKNEGLTRFSDIIRNYQNEIDKLAEQIVSEIVKYMDAKQGGLFIKSNEADKEDYLELLSCYAYERHKFLEKNVRPGEGLVGQCYLEGDLIYLENVPNDYVNISSGIGTATPDSLILVPLKANDQIEGVIELASFNKYEQHHFEFLEQLAEVVASAIITVRTNQHTRGLLEQSQQQAEEMKAQEEEMRQNMEELQATQEQVHRKTQDYEDEIQALKKEISELKGNEVNGWNG